MSKTIIYGLSKNDLHQFAIIAVDEYRKKEITNDSSPIDEEYNLTQKQAAKFLGIRIPTIIDWRKEGIIPRDCWMRYRTPIFYSKQKLLDHGRKTPDFFKSNNR